MLITELGYRWPCQTEGTLINLDEVEPQAGDVLECYFECDRDITTQEAARTIFDIMKLKNDYPNFVLHYANVESRKITLQYSLAPVGGHASPWTWWQVVILVVVIAAAIYLNIRAFEQAWLLIHKAPTGNLSIDAVGCDDTECTYPYGLDIGFSIAGKTYQTGGGTVLIELLVGSYNLVLFDKEGYQTPSPRTVTIVADQTLSITIKYYKEGVVLPTTGWLILDTHPVKGVVYVNAVEIGKAPQQVEVPAPEDYIISFGDVSGYETPPSQTLTVGPGDRIGVDPKYVKIGWPEWAKWLAIIGGGIGGTLIVVKTVDLILARRQA